MDERWGADVHDVVAGLTAVLDRHCSEGVVRAAAVTPDGRWPTLEDALARFGIHEIPPDLETAAAISHLFGRYLAPVPFPETEAVRLVLGSEDADGRGYVPDGYGSAQELLDQTYQVLCAAWVLGAARHLLELAIARTRARHSFGRPIGASQAVSHRLVDVSIQLEGALLLVKKSAWVWALPDTSERTRRSFAAMTWARAEADGPFAARVVHQVLGAEGVTLEEAAHLYSDRIRDRCLRLRRAERGLVQLARDVLDPATRDSIRWLWHHEAGLPIPRWAREADLTGEGGARGLRG